mgnify:CR=1 FL=1|tara:strand:+ start:82019 stop:82399 length:381 start_codon:yes stop_codon:yes gene_type:complete
MSVTFHEVDFAASTETNVVVLRVSGKLTKDDYAIFVPELEQWIVRHGKIRILFDMVDFHGWTVSAAWEDLKLGMKHFSDIERVAMIGDKTWEHGMATFCRPFTRAKVRYFDRADADKAETWISSDE